MAREPFACACRTCGVSIFSFFVGAGPQSLEEVYPHPPSLFGRIFIAVVCVTVTDVNPGIASRVDAPSGVEYIRCGRHSIEEQMSSAGGGNKCRGREMGTSSTREAGASQSLGPNRRHVHAAF